MSMKAAICIITKNRLPLLLRLLFSIKNQITENDQVIIIENGSKTITKKLIAKLKDNFGFQQINLQVKHLSHSSIPRSRNIALRIALKSKPDLVITVDDDCIAHKNWLNAFKIASANNKAVNLFQGSVESIPTNNIYAQATQSLYRTWIKKNLLNNNTIDITDTKNLAFRARKFLKFPKLFNEKQVFASDIEMLLRLKKHVGHPLLVENAVVKHQERTSFTDFINHRARLSLAFSDVITKYPGEIQSATIATKLKNIVKATNNFSLFDQCKLWLALIIVAVIVSYTRLLKKFSTFFKKTVSE